MAGDVVRPRSGYVLGHGRAEQERLIRQASLLAPITERLFREAGIGIGQRVLDLGCGVGDVSIIAARLVGQSGEVVGIDRDASTVALARERAAGHGLRNVTFLQSEVESPTLPGPFDAIVGRLVLSHLFDRTAVLRWARRLVRPGGTVVFQEGSWAPTLAIAARLPLWSRLLSIIRETFVRSGLDPDVGLNLFAAFEEAGFRRPVIHLEVPLSGDGSIADLEIELLRTLSAAAREHNISLADLGDLSTLATRIHAERVEARAVVAFLAIVSVWCRVADSGADAE